MASRTQVPQIDHVIERMLASRVNGVRVSSLHFDPARGLAQPASGWCGVITRAFAELLTQAGIKNDDTDNDFVGMALHHGYRNMPFGPLDDEGMPPDADIDWGHCANIAFWGEYAYLIDFTAAQYGYPELPLVQRMSLADGIQLAEYANPLPDSAFEQVWEATDQVAPAPALER